MNLRQRIARGIPELHEVPFIPYEKFKVERPDTKDSFHALLSKIFAKNPDTLLPEGDIVTFLSDNTSPEIKDFIQKNLMQANNTASDASGHNGIDDDTIAMLTRGRDESEVQYVTRTYDYIKSLRSQNGAKA